MKELHEPIKPPSPLVLSSGLKKGENHPLLSTSTCLIEVN
jgi:hypothetical protein